MEDKKKILRIILIFAILIYSYFSYSAGGVRLCLFHNITGLDCPGCGMSRAFHSIMNLKFMEALHYNIFSLPFFLLLLFILIFDILRLFKVNLAIRLNETIFNSVITVLLFAVLAYGILRNL
jgi:hypothetical protein